MYIFFFQWNFHFQRIFTSFQILFRFLILPTFTWKWLLIRIAVISHYEQTHFLGRRTCRIEHSFALYQNSHDVKHSTCVNICAHNSEIRLHCSSQAFEPNLFAVHYLASHTCARFSNCGDMFFTFNNRRMACVSTFPSKLHPSQVRDLQRTNKYHLNKHLFCNDHKQGHREFERSHFSKLK